MFVCARVCVCVSVHVFEDRRCCENGRGPLSPLCLSCAFAPSHGAGAHVVQEKTYATSLSFSKDGKQFVVMTKKRTVCVFRFLTGKMRREFDESVKTYEEFQQVGLTAPRAHTLSVFIHHSVDPTPCI